MRGFRFSGLNALLVAMFLAAIPASAQPLADRIPSDAIVYIGWAGSEKLGDSYAQSHLKAVLDASSLPQLLAELPPKVVNLLQQKNQNFANDPIAKELVGTLLLLGESAWKHPTAIYVGALDYSGPRPMPKIAVFCEAGKDAAVLADKVGGLIKMIPENAPFKVRVRVWPGDVVVISDFEIGEKVDESLAQREQFKAAMQQGRPNPALVAYFDVEKVVNVASMGINMGADDRTKATWRNILLSTGIAGLRRISVSGGFDGKDWGTQIFIDSPTPRFGLLATLLQSEPVDDNLLKWAPRSATWLSATRLDLAAMMGAARSTTARLAPDASKGLEQGLADLTKMMGMDLQKDFFTALGDEWLVYNSEETGKGILGLCLVNPCRDPGKAEACLEHLEKLANTAMARAGENGITLAINTEKHGDLTLHTWAVPAVAPCWGFKNGNLYVALYPQVLMAAAEYDGAAGKSVLQNPSFIAARKRIGVASPISLGWMDLPKLAPRGYQMMLPLTQTATGFMDIVGLDTPGMVLPPLKKIMPELDSSVSATWVDEAGWHYRSITPFPGSELLGGEQALLTTVAPASVAVILPALAKARQQAMNMRAMVNLRQISVAAIMYSQEHNGALPPDLGAMVPYVGNVSVFLSPQAPLKGSPPPAPGSKAEEIAAWVNLNADYTYIGGSFSMSKLPVPAGECVIAYEKFAGDGMKSVVYADGHAERLWEGSLEMLLNKQKEKK